MTDTLLKTTILLVIVTLASYALRRNSAALRHMLWTLGIVGLVAIPVFTMLVPFRLRVLPTAAADVIRPNSTPSGAVPSSAPASSGAAATEPRSAQTNADTTPTNADWFSLSTGAWLLALWTVGVVLLIGRFVYATVVVGRIARRATPANDRWGSLADRAGRALDVPSGVDVRVSDEVAMPFAFGLIRPMIVLPVSCEEWNDTRREAVIMHEMAHVSRGDLAMNTLSHVVRAVYWFNPLAWLAAHRLRVEGERACDDAVLRAGSLPSDYAEHLLSIVRSVGSTVPGVALAMARRSDFEGRLLAILEPGIPRGRLTRVRAAGMAALFLAVTMPLAALAPANNLVAESNDATRTDADTPATNAEMSQEAERTPTPVQQAGPVPAALTALTQTLDDSNATVRLAAVNSLGSMGDPRAIAALVKVLKEDTDARVREAAAWALGEIDDNRALPGLLDALRTERAANVREKIVRALGEIDDPAAVSGIGAQNRDASTPVRRAVAWALGELEDPRAIPALSTMVQDDDAEVRRYVAEALGNLKAEGSIDALAQMTRDPDAEVRGNAVNALGQFEDRRTLPMLVVALRDANADVRQHAADAIHNIDGLDKAPPALIAALTDENKEVRRTVAHALGGIGDEAAVPALKKAVADNDAEVRHNAAEALSEIGGAEALTALMGLLKDPDPEVRRIAAQAIGKRR